MSYYIIGIAGQGLRALAEYILDGGEEIWGYESLNNMVFIPNRLKNRIRNPKDVKVNIVIYSDGMKSSWEKHWKIYQYFLEKNIPCISRQHYISNILKLQQSISVTGSCGKSSTTALLVHLFLEQQKKVSFLCGAELKNIQLSGQNGQFPLLIYECDESLCKFSKIKSEFGIITNIYYDHLENYNGSKKKQQDYFREWMNNISKLLILNGDDDFLFQNKTLFSITIGFLERNDIKMEKISKSCFSFKNQLVQMSPFLEGEQYMFNYASAIYFYQFFLKVNIFDFTRMKGLKNRMERFDDFINNIIYIMDNGHQPISISKTIDYLKQTYQERKMTLYFWPKQHYLYHDSYKTCFIGVDKLFIIHKDLALLNNFYKDVYTFHSNITCIKEFSKVYFQKNSLIVFIGLCYQQYDIQEFLISLKK